MQWALAVQGLSSICCKWVHGALCRVPKPQIGLPEKEWGRWYKTRTILVLLFIWGWARVCTGRAPKNVTDLRYLQVDKQAKCSNNVNIYWYSETHLFMDSFRSLLIIFFLGIPRWYKTRHWGNNTASNPTTKISWSPFSLFHKTVSPQELVLPGQFRGEQLWWTPGVEVISLPESFVSCI